jgi:hypothetical protein
VLHEAIVTCAVCGDIVQIVGEGAGSVGEVLAPDRQCSVAPIPDAMDDACLRKQAGNQIQMAEFS